MYQISFYVPETHLEPVKEALFAAGAGRVGLYEHCAWQTKGQGQFKPLAGNQAFIGTTGVLETVVEYKVELICSESCVSAAILALKKAHPYEEVPYFAFKTMLF